MKLDSDSLTGKGEGAWIIMTGLLNLAMPLIRYTVGDIGVFTDGECSCSVKLLLMKNRGSACRLYTPPLWSADLPIVLINWMSTNAVGVLQYQIVQEAKNQIVVRLFSGETSMRMCYLPQSRISDNCFLNL